MKSKQQVEYNYVWPKCGYKTIKMGKLTEYPLCKTCTGCGKPVRNCTWSEGE